MDWIIPAALGLAGLSLWFEHQAKEREAAFRQETYRKMLERPGQSAEAVRALLREDEERRAEERVTGLRLSGLVTLATGVGILVFLYVLVPERRVYLVGIIPALVGLMLLLQSALLRRGNAR